MFNVYKTQSMKKFNGEKDVNPHFSKHNINVKKHMLVCGMTGSGKSNFIVNLLSQMSDTFKHIYIFTKMPNEPIYQMLKEKLGDDLTLARIEEVPNPDELKSVGQSLCIFDDFLAESSNIFKKLVEYAIVTRKKYFSCVYLTQNYYSVPKILREQCTYLALLSMTDKRNLSLIVSTLSIDVDASTIKRIIANATKNPLNICLIDIRNRDLNKKFRRNWSDFYILEDKNGEPLNTITLYGGSGLLN